jgi:hypothetical protein
MIFWSLCAFIWFKNIEKMLLQMTNGFLQQHFFHMVFIGYVSIVLIDIYCSFLRLFKVTEKIKTRSKPTQSENFNSHPLFNMEIRKKIVL